MIPSDWPPCPVYRPQSDDLQATWAEHLRACEVWQTECFRLAVHGGMLDLDGVRLQELPDGRIEFTIRVLTDDEIEARKDRPVAEGGDYYRALGRICDLIRAGMLHRATTDNP